MEILIPLYHIVPLISTTPRYPHVCFLKHAMPRQGSPVVVQMIAAGGRAEQAGVKPGAGPRPRRRTGRRHQETI